MVISAVTHLYMSNQRLDQLEEKLAYLEAANAELSEEIFRQQQEITTLTKAHHQLLERFAELQQADSDAIPGSKPTALEQRPPHY
jgi:SlyX protein